MKWILILTMPSGRMFAVSDHEGQLKLIGIKEGQDNSLRGVLGFDTEQEAREWMRETAKLSEPGRKMMELTEPMLANEMQ